MAPQPISLSAYARRRGVSAKAVSKAVAEGRLRGSVTHINGAPKIADPDLADREWNSNTRPRIDQARPMPMRERSKPAERRGHDGDLPDDVVPYEHSRARREMHAARREGALADMAELERDKLTDALVSVGEARAYIIEKFTVVKTRLLGVPSAVAQQLPQLASEVEPVVDRLIREVLEELAAEDDDGDGGEEEAE